MLFERIKYQLLFFVSYCYGHGLQIRAIGGHLYYLLTIVGTVCKTALTIVGYQRSWIHLICAIIFPSLFSTNSGNQYFLHSLLDDDY